MISAVSFLWPNPPSHCCWHNNEKSITIPLVLVLIGPMFIVTHLCCLQSTTNVLSSLVALSDHSFLFIYSFFWPLIVFLSAFFALGGLLWNTSTLFMSILYSIYNEHLFFPFVFFFRWGLDRKVAIMEWLNIESIGVQSLKYFFNRNSQGSTI